MRVIFRVAVVSAGALLASPVLAQITAAPPSGAASMDKTVKSKDCSAQADAKGLHGKARKHFRSACKHGKM